MLAIYYSLFQVRYHILGRHLRLRPYRCGYCSFSHHTRWAVEDHVVLAHAGENMYIKEQIKYNSDAIKKMLLKVRLNGRVPSQLETSGGLNTDGVSPEYNEQTPRM